MGTRADPCNNKVTLIKVRGNSEEIMYKEKGCLTHAGYEIRVTPDKWANLNSTLPWGWTERVFEGKRQYAYWQSEKPIRTCSAGFTSDRCDTPVTLIKVGRRRRLTSAEVALGPLLEQTQALQ